MSFPHRWQPTRRWSRSTQLHTLVSSSGAEGWRREKGRDGALLKWTLFHILISGSEQKIGEDSENSHNISSHSPPITFTGKMQRRGYAQVESAPHSHLRERAECWRQEKAATGLCSGRLGFILSSQAEHTLLPASRV